MRVACPSCSAAYDIPDALLGVGRAVRCARCQHQWVPRPVDLAAPADVMSPPEPPPPPPSVQPPSPPPAATPAGQAADADTPGFSAMDHLAMNARPLPGDSPGKLRAAWAVSVLLLILAAGAAYVWRSQLIDAWPPSQRLYAALGLAPGQPPPPGHGPPEQPPSKP